MTKLTEKSKNLPDDSLSKTTKHIQKLKRKLKRHVWLLRGIAIAAMALILFAGYLGLKNVYYKTGLEDYLNFVQSFVIPSSTDIGSAKGRTNVLILGKGGGNHDSPELTDSIIFASFPDNNNQKSVMISLPRDIWMPEFRDKINSAYMKGNEVKPGGGIILAKTTVEEIVGEPVHYAMVIDFAGFEQIINEMGGIDVDVERAFTDEKYPIAGRENDECGGDPFYRCRYETIAFEKGIQQMDGETALKFARSRHAEGDEGNDLARAARQQKIITAMQKKAVSSEVMLNPAKALRLWRLTKTITETDIPPEALAAITRRAVASRGNLNNYVLPEDLIINPPYSNEYDNLYVFIPKGGDWTGVHDYVRSKLSE